MTLALTAQAEAPIGFILTMEGAEPLGDDPYLVQIFHQFGLRMLSLTLAPDNGLRVLRQTL
jgi:microsomal dipeptidase-like Zn-dependent dipeptidase